MSWGFQVLGFVGRSGWSCRVDVMEQVWIVEYTRAGSEEYKGRTARALAKKGRLCQTAENHKAL